MAVSPVGLAPPNYALHSPRPDLRQAAGSAALSAVVPMEGEIIPRGAVVDSDVTDELDFKAIHTTLVEDFEAAEDASRTSRKRPNATLTTTTRSS